MLRITKITDYGFVLLAHMATHDEGGLHNARDLAEATDLAPPTVSKVLKILTQGKILVSHQGSKGGYALSRTADAITAADIIETIEGPVALTDCSIPGHVCPRGCQVSPGWQQVNAVVHAALTGLTLAEMAGLTQQAQV